ncbi:MAG: hypothetical protein OEY50_00995 [Nitrospinota bacterium]|nr:hypothetical protein [Nitrospinota bacterium]MDH5677168.1 hypothetical protein [Nitrospinota bacterium]
MKDMEISILLLPTYKVVLLPPEFYIIYSFALTRAIQYRSVAILYLSSYSLLLAIAAISTYKYISLTIIHRPMNDESICNQYAHLAQHLFIYLLLFVIIHIVKFGAHPIRMYDAMEHEAKQDMENYWRSRENSDNARNGHDNKVSMLTSVSNNVSQLEKYLPYLVASATFMIYYPLYAYLRPCS